LDGWVFLSSGLFQIILAADEQRRNDLTMNRFGAAAFWRGAFLAVILGLAAGCTSVTIKSNKDESSVRQLNRLSIVINHGEVSNNELSNYLIDGFKECFSNAPVQVDYSIISALDLDTKSQTERVKSFNPDAVLVVSVSTYVIAAEYGGYPEIKYDASLFDPGLTKRFWRAAVDNSGGTALMKLRMHQMAGKIATQLQTDGFLTGIEAPNPPRPAATPAHR